MMVRQRSRETLSARILGGVSMVGIAGALVFLGGRLGVDASFLAGAAVGLVIALLWRPARRCAEAVLHPVAFGSAQRGPLRFLAAFCAFFVPLVASPLVALLVGFVNARAALIALLVAFGESALRLVLGIDPGPGTRPLLVGGAGRRT